MVDLLVGAPMFMVRTSGGRLEEMGRVYIYLQRSPLHLEITKPSLTGKEVFGRFGSTIAPLGDLNQDGFNGKSGTINDSSGEDTAQCHEKISTDFSCFCFALSHKPCLHY